METKSIKNYELRITNLLGFTLIEVLVVLGIAVVLLVSVGGIMTTSFKAKNSNDTLATVQSEAQLIMAALKKNVLDADKDGLVCPSGVGTSLSFATKSGGQTTLECDAVLSRIASVSAQSGSFQLTNNGVMARNCDQFVTCNLDSDQAVTVVSFNLDLGVTGGGTGDQFWEFESKVVPR